MSDQSKGMMMFLLGAVTGVAIGYFLASDNKEEIISNIKDKVNKVKNDKFRTNKDFNKSSAIYSSNRSRSLLTNQSSSRNHDNLG